MVNGTSKIFTDRVGGLALLGIGATAIAFLGLRRRNKPKDPVQEGPADPSITKIEINPLPLTPEDGMNVEFQIVVEGGSGDLGGVLMFGDGGAVSITRNDVIQVREGVFNIIINHVYNLANTTNREVEAGLEIQDAASGIVNERFVILTITPAPSVEPPPVAVISNFNQTVESGTSPLLVGFQVLPSDPRSQIVWNFGDGSSQVFNQTQLNHLYSGEGVVNGFVEVTNSQGESDRINFSITLQAPIPPPPDTPDIISNFFQDRAVINEDSFVQFSISLGVVQRQIIWDFGDGSARIFDRLSVDHQYRTAGQFSGFVEVEAQDGSRERRNFNVTVNASVTRLTNRIDLLFSGSLNVGESFAARSNPGGGVQPFVNFDWDMGDGNRLSGMNVGHQYSLPGDYTITCTVTDSAGQTARATRIVSVTISPLQFGDADVSLSLNFTSSGDVVARIKNNRNDIRLDGRYRIVIFDGRSQVDTRTTFPTIRPGQTVSEFYIFRSTLREGVTLRAFAEIKDNATSRLLDDDFLDFIITPTAPACVATGSNARTLATQIVNGTFNGTFPGFFVNTANFFLQGLITTTVFVDAFNFEVSAGRIVCA